MGITRQFGDDLIREQVAAFRANLENATTFMLKYLGEELVKHAKEMHNYTDQSGNLTNSIGYVVAHKKEVVSIGGLVSVGEETGGEEAGMKLINTMVKRNTAAFSLIIVAGMNYAAYVEALGYNVILPAELKAKHDVPAAFERLRKVALQKAHEKFGIWI
ncbi:MAG: hypothetical protein LBE04_01870 [Prevotellaceae bacterium]|jgi:hypothetical protein|nr:hypothetical protein [Prevotellaceae bacterium]